MVNSHYIPQFILRHFCRDGKILYADLREKTLEQRSTRSVFSERGYYPDWLEGELCRKVESQFANVFNNKILSQRNTITLDAEDMLWLKKFLAVTILRNRTIGYDDPALEALTSEEAHLLTGDVGDNVRRVLECATKDDVRKYLDSGFGSQDGSMQLVAYLRDVFGSYTVFVSARRSREDFVIPDTAHCDWEGPLKVRKLDALIDAYRATGDRLLADIMHKLTPHDYTVFPLTSEMAVLCVSPFYKLCMSDSPYNIMFPEEAPSLGAAMGFGNTITFAPPKVKGTDDERRRYVCEVKHLKWADVAFLNGLLIRSASRYVGFASKARIQRSVDACCGRHCEADLSFLGV